MKENRKTHKITSMLAFVLMVATLLFVDFNVVEAEKAFIQIEKPKITQVSQQELIDGCIKIEVESFVPYFKITDKEREIVECIVSGEAGNESNLGKMLVAQCILDACIQDEIRPDEVRTKYQYSGWREEVTDEVKQAVSDIFDYGKLGVDDNILWFYAPKYAKGNFHNTQRFVIEEGNHLFFAPRN